MPLINKRRISEANKKILLSHLLKHFSYACVSPCFTTNLNDQKFTITPHI